MYRTVSFLKLVTLTFLFTFLTTVGAQTGLSAAQLKLSWTDNSSNESGFNIERKTGTSGTFVQIAVLGANTTSYIDNGLANATTYCYRVNAFNSAGSSAYTNVPCATTPSATSTSYLLSIAKAGTGSGTVSGAGIDCGGDCSESFTSGTKVGLSAKADSGSVFAGWTGVGCNNRVTVNVDMNCTATFNHKTYTLTVKKSGKGSGMVARTGIGCGNNCSETSIENSSVLLATTTTGIDCGSNCVENVAHGHSVSLAATPASGSIFAGWRGRGCDSSVIVTGNVTCTAIFNPIPYTLTVSKAGTGSGRVTARGMNCGDDCSGSYLNGSTVKVRTRPDRGSHFAGWTGQGCDSKMTIAGDMNCTAIFDLNIYELAIIKAGTGSGTVTAAGIDCGNDCIEGVTHGSAVALKATPANGSRFAGWKGKSCSSGTFTVTRDAACTATFIDVLASMDRIGVYRPSTGEWFLDRNATQIWENGADSYVDTFNAADSMPLIGDWRNTGVAQLGLFQPSTLQWYLDLNNNKAVDGCEIDACEGPFGEPNDIAVVGKWDRNGNDRIGTFRPSNGYWYLDKNDNGEFEGCTKDHCAILHIYGNGDLPVVGDWSGNGRTQLGLFRPGTGEWFLDHSGNFAWDGCGRDVCFASFGTVGDLPVAGDWDGTGSSKIGIFRPSTGEWFLDYNGNGQWDGCTVDVCVAGFGAPGDIPVIGRW